MPERDRKIRHNVFRSLLYQFLTNLLGLLVVPMSLAYMDKERYGIWINASVMVTWLQNMNFGMGFGMQNKVAEAMANGNEEEARDYVSIVYRYSVLIAGGILIAGLIAGQFINWNKLFNTSEISAGTLRFITAIAFFCFLIYFILGNLVPLLNALQLAAIPKIFGLLTNLLTIAFLWLIARFSDNDLALAAIALALPTPLVLAGAHFLYFRKKLRFLLPRWRITDRGRVSHVFSLGVKFFIMQLTTLALTQSGAFIITQELGPEEVTPYNVINRYFYFIYFIFSLAITPYWSGFTDAFVKKDGAWIRKAVNQLTIAGVGGTCVVAIMLLAAFWLIPIWSNRSFEMEPYRNLVYASALYTVSLFFASIVSTFLNGISLLNFQLIVQVVAALLTVGCSLLLIRRFGAGPEAVNWAMLAGQLFYLLLCGWQTRRFIRKRLGTAAE